MKIQNIVIGNGGEMQAFNPQIHNGTFSLVLVRDDESLTAVPDEFLASTQLIWGGKVIAEILILDATKFEGFLNGIVRVADIHKADPETSGFAILWHKTWDGIKWVGRKIAYPFVKTWDGMKFVGHQVGRMFTRGHVGATTNATT